MGVTANRINEYWYTHDYSAEGPFLMGTEEIHTNVKTPEEADQSGMGDGNYLTWKPLVFQNEFKNVFLKNFQGGNFADWMTFEGAPTVIGQPKGISTKTALVISGTKAQGGIRNLKYAFVMVDKGSDPDDVLMARGVFRVFEDQDDISEYVSWPGSMSRSNKALGNGSLLTPFGNYR